MLNPKSDAPNASNVIIDASRIPTYYYYKMKTDDNRYLINDVLSQYNPLALLEAGGFQKHGDDSFIGSMAVDYEIISGLKAKGSLGYDLMTEHRYIRSEKIGFYSSETATEPSTYANEDQRTEDYNAKRYFLTAQFLLDFNRTFNSIHNVTALLGASNELYKRQANELKYTYTDELGLPTTETEVVKSESYNTPAQTQDRIIRSLFGRAGYSYMDRYYGEFSFRYDGSSKFAKDYRWGFFPSFSAGWRLSEDGFMSFYKSNIGGLKLRGSYGILGNQSVDDYAYMTTYTVYSNQYSFNNNAVSGTGFDLGNVELQWEKTAIFNVGVDATFFNSKFQVSLDYFNKITTGILLTPVAASVFGGTPSYENAGEMENRGWEASFIYNFITGRFKHNLNLNIADSKNKVTDFGGEERIHQSDQMLQLIREGESLNSYYGLLTDGLFQNYEEIGNSALPTGTTVEPGDVKYKDMNSDGVIDDDDRRVLGNGFPRYTFGLTYNVSFHGFDFNMLVQGVGKREMYLPGELVEPFHSNYSYNIFEHQLDFWSPTNTDAKYPRLSSPGSASNTNNYQKPSDIYLFNAAYVRLKIFSWDIPLPKN